MRVSCPNILDALSPIYVKLKVGSRNVTCLLTRVYYHDTQYERRLWVDVKAVDMFHSPKQKVLTHIPMERLDYRNYATVVSLSFQQAESDTQFKLHLKEAYACRVDLRLSQEYEDMMWYWQGVMTVLHKPARGHVFVRGVNIPIDRFAHVCVVSEKPLVLCVKEHNRIKIESSIAIHTDYNMLPLVCIDGDYLHVIVHIGGKLFSGKQDIVSPSGRIDYGAPTEKLSTRSGS